MTSESVNSEFLSPWTNPARKFWLFALPGLGYGWFLLALDFFARIASSSTFLGFAGFRSF